MVDTSLYSVLSNATGITSIVGANGIWPVVLPTAPTLPAVVYSIVGASTKPTFTTAGMTRYRVQIDSYGPDWPTAQSLRAAVISSLNGYLDANMTIQLIQPTDLFDHVLLQFRAMAEFYVFSDL